MMKRAKLKKIILYSFPDKSINITKKRGRRKKNRPKLNFNKQTKFQHADCDIKKNL